ncbi:unnamed protein product [Rotaria magnacalcarata]|uniref:Reverse transcriptase domain-containing protein n=2 Tax=Rotaria magnacalcarata TaxID=392030 RepID=A0A816UD74_9BILA|nr:unnamed protein product [Rotaria magnacalcarata]CAF4000641.1 unnamed protein product [Rotaria magnacalcarata]
MIFTLNSTTSSYPTANNTKPPESQHYLNKNSNTSYHYLPQRDQYSRVSGQAADISSSAKFIPPLLANNTSQRNNNSYHNNTNNHQYRNYSQQHQKSFQDCFKCGSLDHIARDCHHFEKRILFTTHVNNKDMQIMIDNGAQNSFVHERNLTLNDNFKPSIIPQQKFYMADGLTPFVVTGIVTLSILIGDFLTSILAYVTKNLCTDLILGMDYLLKYDLELKPKKKSILFYLHDKSTKIPIDQESTSFDFNNSLSHSERMRHDNHLNTIAMSSSFNTPKLAISHFLHHLTDPMQCRALQVLSYKFKSLFDTSTYTIATTQISHVIETHPHTPPVPKCYPGNRTSTSEMHSIINKLLASGLVLIDYEKLNAITIKDNYPGPNMELALQTLGFGYNFFSKLDLKSEFWQFPINPQDRFKTAFITTFGLYEWNVLPQGLRNAPPNFQRIMNNVLSSCIDFSLVYLDDIVIFSRTHHEHLIHLEKVLNALKLQNLTLNPTKYEIAQQTIEYLGHVISSKTITPLPEKIKSIALLPEPKSLAQANRLIGALSWYRKFIPQFASIAVPIHVVTNLSKS